MKFSLPVVNKIFQPASQLSQYLVLKFSPAQVEVAIFKPAQELKSQPDLLGSGQIQVNPTSFRGHQLLDFDSVLDNASLALEQAVLAAGVKPKETILLWPAGLAKLVFLTVRFTRQNPSEPISAAEIKNILVKVKEETLTRAQEQLNQLIFPHQDYQLESLLPINYRINEQNVANPTGLPTAQIELTAAYHFIRPEDSQVYTDLLAELSLQPLIKLGSHFALTYGLSQTHPQGIVIKVNKNSTHLGLFHQRKIRQIDSFNLGAEKAADPVAGWLQAVQLKLAKWQELYQHQALSQKIFLSNPTRAQLNLEQLGLPVQTLSQNQALEQLSYVYSLL